MKHITEALAELRESIKAADAGVSQCDDCRRPVFADLIVPCDVWLQISPTSDLTGFLCPNCIIERLTALGIRSPVALFSGNVDSLSNAEMSALRRIENIELALEGFRNRWGAALDERIREGGIDPHRPVGPPQRWFHR